MARTLCPDAARAKHFHFDGLDRARFRKPVGPGDQLLLSAQLERSVETTMHFSTRALVGNIEVASAEIVIIAPAKDE
jgi:3-hydroxyacyl-[acyl-carrier-protein] dehydratase